ncbi:MAG: cupin domain-containing protein [Chloroflexota bacterium]
MNKFIPRSEMPKDTLDWGVMGWISNPKTTQNKDLTVLDVELFPGQGHNFHKHPDQEEVIVCIKGTVEQWIDKEKRMLKPGDAIYVDADVVHATFNNSDESAFVLAILGPCVGEEGYEVVEVGDQAPWNTMRS